VTLPEGVADGRWRSVFTGETVDARGRLALADALGAFPVGLLLRE
jgi:maltooligosyltrehalose synthase